jgi:hypothetical protein
LAHRAAVALLALSALAALAAFCFGSALGPWLAAFAGATFPVALIGLGAGRLRGIGWALGLVWLLLAGGLFTVLALPEGGPDLFGLPLATALMLFVLVPVPLLVLGFVYAATFERSLRQEDLDRIRRFRGRES